MKIFMKFCIVSVAGAVLSGCATQGMNHIGYNCIGKSKQEVLGQFGPPEEVLQSIAGVETWEYTMGSGVKTYTFNGDTCMRNGSRISK